MLLGENGIGEVIQGTGRQGTKRQSPIWCRGKKGKESILFPEFSYLLKLAADLEVITQGRNTLYYLHPCNTCTIAHTIVYTERTLLQKAASAKSLLAQSTKQGMQMSESQI